VKRTWPLVLGGGVLALGLLAGPLLLVPGFPQSPLRAKYDCVRLGMGLDEVHAIMGRPRQVLGFGTFYRAEAYYDDMDGEVSDTATIVFRNGLVRKKEWRYPRQPNWWKSIRDRLGW
jgi:hypothetical protein